MEYAPVLWRFLEWHRVCHYSFDCMLTAHSFACSLARSHTYTYPPTAYMLSERLLPLHFFVHTRRTSHSLKKTAKVLFRLLDKALNLFGSFSSHRLKQAKAKAKANQTKPKKEKSESRLLYFLLSLAIKITLNCMDEEKKPRDFGGNLSNFRFLMKVTVILWQSMAHNTNVHVFLPHILGSLSTSHRLIRGFPRI